ncbi:hypothetical protein Hanom_Chr12g01162411 [Helianthus anomalus]
MPKIKGKPSNNNNQTCCTYPRSNQRKTSDNNNQICVIVTQHKQIEPLDSRKVDRPEVRRQVASRVWMTGRRSTGESNTHILKEPPTLTTPPLTQPPPLTPSPLTPSGHPQKRHHLYPPHICVYLRPMTVVLYLRPMTVRGSKQRMTVVDPRTHRRRSLTSISVVQPEGAPVVDPINSPVEKWVPEVFDGGVWGSPEKTRGSPVIQLKMMKMKMMIFFISLMRDM